MHHQLSQAGKSRKMLQTQCQLSENKHKLGEMQDLCYLNFITELDFVCKICHKTDSLEQNDHLLCFTVRNMDILCGVENTTILVFAVSSQIF